MELNLGKYLAQALLETGMGPKVALFPGDFKPPHNGHFKAVEKLLKATDQVVILISPQIKDGITADEAVAVWNLYKPLLDGSVELKITTGDPVEEARKVIESNPDSDFIVAFGKNNIDRYRNIEKNDNAKIFDAGDIEITDLKSAINKKDEEKIKKFIPNGIGTIDFLSAIGKQPKETPAEETPPAEEPAPEQPLQESPPINFEDEPPYQNYILQNRRKIEQAAYAFNVPIDDMEFAFNGGTEVVLNDDMWKEMENTKSYNMKTLEDAISHALKVGIDPKPYIDHIKKKEDIPLPLVLQYSQGKYYLVGGEVILSIYRSLGVIPTVLLATLNLQNKTLPEPVFENFFGEIIQKDIKEDLDHYGMIPEYQINLDDVYEYNKQSNFFTFFDDVNHIDTIAKLKPQNNLVEFKFYNVDKDGKILGFNRLKQYNPKVMNTIFKIFLNEVLPNHNKILIQPAGNIRYRLFRALINNNLSKEDYNITVKDEIEQPYIIITKKEPINESLDKKKLSESQTGTLGEFIKYAIQNLGIQQPPTGLTLSYNTKDAQQRSSFGTFNPNNDKIWLYVRNRNMADILRTLAHELVHRKQAEDGRLDITSGETGSEIENEANAQAGILLRNFGKENKHIYEQLLKEGVYGDWLFGDEESGVKIGWYQEEYEKDTPAEKKLFDFLKKYADSEMSDYSSINLDSLIPVLKKLKKQYPEIGNVKVASGYIYRGTAISKEKLDELEKNAKTEPYNQGYIILNQTYSSRRKVQSWSTSYFTATGFAFTTSETKGGLPVVMRAKVSDADLYLNPDFMNKLSNQVENETFNIINPIPVDIMVLQDYKDEFEDIEAGYLHTKKKLNEGWNIPSLSQLKQEFRVEHELKGNDFFDSEEDFLQAVKNGKIITVTPSIDAQIDYRSGTTSKDELLDLIRSYRSYPKYRNEETIQSLYDAFETNQSIDLPIIIEFSNGSKRIFSGNTRMDIAFQLGINPKALLIKSDR